jgi:hypothetical protein
MGLTLLAQASMPLKYWDHAFLTATHLINHTPAKLLAYDTPLHHFLGGTPDYSTLRVFGCACWPNLLPYNANKLQFRTIRCTFLGYSNLYKRFKCLDIASGCVYVFRDVVFDESIFPFAQLHPTAGVCYTSDVLLLPDSVPQASTNLPLDNVPTNACLSPTTLWSSKLLQQKILASSSTTDPGIDRGVAPPPDLAAVPGPTRADTGTTSTAPIGGPPRVATPVAAMPPRCGAPPVPAPLVSVSHITDMPIAHLIAQKI